MYHHGFCDMIRGKTDSELLERPGDRTRSWAADLPCVSSQSSGSVVIHSLQYFTSLLLCSPRIERVTRQVHSTFMTLFGLALVIWGHTMTRRSSRGLVVIYNNNNQSLAKHLEESTSCCSVRLSCKLHDDRPREPIVPWCTAPLPTLIQRQGYQL